MGSLGKTLSFGSFSLKGKYPALAVLFLALVLRLAHLAFVMGSPLTFEPGPEEADYQRFGEAVSAWLGQNAPEFAAMNAGYGFLLGGVFHLFDDNLFVVYLLQALADTATVAGVMIAGRLLGRERAGRCGAALYAVTSTAIMFSATLTVDVWASAFATWWVVAALTVPRSRSAWGWAALGALSGLGAVLESTLLWFVLFSLMLPLLYRWPPDVADKPTVWRRFGLVAVGGIVVLSPWSWRNYQTYGTVSPLPSNTGIVLHELYNDRNPEAGSDVSGFAHFRYPIETWRADAAEADRRAGKQLSPGQIDAYWWDEALHFMAAHPATVVADVLRKNLLWFGSSEVEAGRSVDDEKRFSPILRVIPQSGVWLLGIGLVGLLCFDRRWLIVAAPIAAAWITMLLLLPDTRFRFQAASMLALGGGAMIDLSLRFWRDRRHWQPMGIALVAATTISCSAVIIGHRYPGLPTQAGRVAWGYINLGSMQKAWEIAERAVGNDPGDGESLQARGYLLIVQSQYAAATRDLQRAILLRPYSSRAHYTLARAYAINRRHDLALAEAKIAVDLNASPLHQALLDQLGDDGSSLRSPRSDPDQALLDELGYDSGGSLGGNDPSSAATGSP
ncbi:MAG TPA: glycosyltransferase family 39 protein [Steroidobacteraceae bacterium]|jgi:hypothetical protein|nr:glycosyltransferase family 39 protein [Steroidobacteraceae bacterium]